MAEYPLDEFMTEKKTMIMKPFIELYLEHLQETFPQELEVSISMTESTVFLIIENKRI